MINLNSFCEKESCKGCRHICECNQYHIDEEEEAMPDYYQAREIIKEYCQNEDCTEDCKECTYPLSVIRCGEEGEYKGEQKENNRIESHTVKTKGDLIRESNENLADYIIKFTVLADKQRVIDYLNQPVESDQEISIEKHTLHIQV